MTPEGDKQEQEKKIAELSSMLELMHERSDKRDDEIISEAKAESKGEIERLKEMVGAMEKIVGIVKEIRSLDPAPMKRFGSVARANELIAQIDPALEAYEASKALAPSPEKEKKA